MEVFRVRKWECNEHFRTAICKLSPDFDVIALLIKDELKLFSLRTTKWFQTIQHVSSFTFEENSQQETTRILILDKNKVLILYEIDEDELTKVTDCVDLNQLTQANIFEVQSFSADVAVILVDRKSILWFDVDKKISSTLNLTSVPIVDVVTNFNHLYVLTNEFIYKIHFNEIVFEISLQNYVQSSNKSKQLCLSSDEKSFVVVCENGSCFYLNFGKAKNEKPFHIKGLNEVVPKNYSYWEFIKKNVPEKFCQEMSKNLNEDHLLSSVNFSAENNATEVKPVLNWTFVPDCNILNVEVCSHFVYLSCEKQSGSLEIILLDAQNGKEVENLKLPQESIPVFGVRHGNPNLILANDYISVVIYLPEQDMLLNKMMVYSNASLADKILQLNAWSDVALPLSFLEWGLHNHQLGLVALYLKCQKKTWKESDGFDEEIQFRNLNEMMKLIFSVIEKHQSDEFASTFVEQILKLSLEYLLSLLADFCIKEKNFQQRVAYYVKKLRIHLKSPVNSSRNSVDESGINFMSDEEMTLCNALMQRQLPAYQNNLRRRHKEHSLKDIENDTKLLAREFLNTRDITMARVVLANMGINADEYLRGICENTVQRHLRDYLIGNFPQPEEFKADVLVLKEFERLYPNTNFEFCKENLVVKQSKWNENYININIPNIPKFIWSNFELDAGELSNDSPFYSNLCLNWVQKMTDEQCRLALFERNQSDDEYWWIRWRYNISRNGDEFFIPLPVSLQFIYKELDRILCLPFTREIWKNYLAALGFTSTSDGLRRVSLTRTIRNNPNSFLILIDLSHHYNLANILYEFKEELNKHLIDNSSPILKVINSFAQWGNETDTNKIFDTSIEQISAFNKKKTQDALEILLFDYPLAALYCFGLPNCKNKDELKSALSHPRYAGYLQHYLNDVRDISLYQLLQDSVPFNISRLFGKNSLDDKENSIVTPFDTDAGHEVTLDFLYYLKQGRPCYAYAQFLLQEGSRGSKLNKRRVQTACALATSLAFTTSTPSISSGCVVFIELLNKSSDWLRLRLEAVNYLQNQGVSITDHSNVDCIVSTFEESLRCQQPSDIESVAGSFIQQLRLIEVMIKLCELCKLEFPTQFMDDWDWLLVLVIAQKCGYQVDQVRGVFETWKRKELSEHIVTALQQVHLEQKNTTLTFISPKRNTRNLLYEKLGLVEHQKNIPIEQSSEEPTVNISVPPVEKFRPPDFFQSVLLCTESEDIAEAFCLHAVSSKNPVFTLLTEGINETMCLNAWLSSVMRVEEDSLVKLLIRSFKNCWWSLFFARGFRLFCQSDPKVLLFRSLDSLFNKCCYYSASSDMAEFLQACSKISTCQLADLESLVWDILQCIFLNCPLQHQVFQLLKILNNTNFTLLFPCKVNIGLLSSIQESVMTTSIILPFDNILRELNVEVWANQVIEDLLKAGFRKEAEHVLKITKVNPNALILYRLEEKLRELEGTPKWKRDAKLRFSFWSYCSQTCSETDVPTNISANYFKNCAKKVESRSEQFYLLKLALKYQPEDTELEREMWLQRIEAHNRMESISEEFKTFLTASETSAIPRLQTKSSVMNKVKSLPVGQLIFDNDDDDSAVMVEEIIGQELDEQRVVEALRVAILFKHKSRNLQIILTCMDLAEGIVNPKDINYDDYELTHNKTTHERTGQSVLGVLEHLSRDCTHGRNYCTRILSYVKVAESLRINYTEVIEYEDVFDLIKLLSKTNSREKISLTKQLFTDNCISDECIVHFICEEVSSLISNLNLATDNSAAFSQFEELLKLMTDPSLVGTQLITMSEDEVTPLATSVELIIWAHYCFSLSCNTEGIALVLQRAHELTSMMNASHAALAVCDVKDVGSDSSMKLIIFQVHLLTGVGRYNEMIYIFDLLYEWDLFEQLLTKGSDKVYFLKTAIVDYLWRFRHTDFTKFEWTAHKFFLFREWGDMLYAKVNSLFEGATTAQELDQILRYLEDAAESYSKADCHRYAQKCCLFAELVALQIYFLGSDTKVLGLSDEQVEKFTVSHRKFYDAYLVATAYEVKADWVTAVFNNVIILGDLEYLAQFDDCIGVSNNLAEEVVARLEKEKTITDKMLQNCTVLLKRVDDILVAFKLGKQLKLDLVKEMMKSESNEIIRDVTARNSK